MATPDYIKTFNQSRKISNPRTLCYAADVSLNFDQTGQVTACCFNRSYVLGVYPDQTIKEIWTGKKIGAIRKALQNNSLKLGCEQCQTMLMQGNFDGALIKLYDNYVPRDKKNWSKALDPLNLPTMFEFEISNTCNLECIMCGGKWSSAIRKNREHLPAIKSPYDEGFLAQVREFIPTLTRANFLGGEPFLISLYYDIWEDIVALNPDMDVAITSNGTTLSKRARAIIDKLTNLKITLSIDSLEKSTYESIRLNASYEGVMSNIEFLLQTGKLASFSVCPIIQNRLEIPSIIQFCLKNNIDIFFNVVNEPLGGRKPGIHTDPLDSESDETGAPKSDAYILPETSMRFLSKVELSETIEYYQQFRKTVLEPDLNLRSLFNLDVLKRRYRRYQNPLDGLINQLIAWREEQDSVKPFSETSSPETQLSETTEKEDHQIQDQQFYKDAVMRNLKKVENGQMHLNKIFEFEALLQKENESTFNFYKQLSTSPTDAIVNSCIEFSPKELLEIYLQNKR